MLKELGLRLAAVLVVCTMMLGCAHLGGPSTSEIEPIELGALPPKADFVPIGSIGAAYWVEGGRAMEARFPTPVGAVDSLLPATIRLFRFDEKTDRWSEIVESRYDEKSRELIGANLRPGFYTAFGWSANPAENALQRILVDATLGYGALTDAPNFNLRPDQGERVPIDAFRRELVRSWLHGSFSFPITSCQFLDVPACPEQECRRAASRIISRSCRVRVGTEPSPIDCPQPQCCQCESGRFTERFVVPLLIIMDQLPIPCGSTPRGILCPTCPNGLSCPRGRFVDTPQIEPLLDVPNYAFLDEIGLDVVIDDVMVREVLQDIVEGVTGNEYPVPPPWPN